MTKDEALKLALETLEYAGPSWIDARQPAITAIKEALAQVEQEPVAWRIRCTDPMRDWVLMYRRPKTEEQFSNMEIQPLYTTPPQRTWVGLTDEEAMQICVDCGCLSEDWLTLLDAIEAKLKEKNT